MIIINNSGFLKYNNFKFRCAVGKAGIGEKKREGDNVTPSGTFKIVKIYYRSDRIKKISSKFRAIKITKNMGWCDDPNNKNYNQLINLPSRCDHEKLFKKNNIYDIILVLNYNMKPVVKNKGSAIFIHVAKKNYQPTRGCIALKKIDLLKLLSKIRKNVKIKIN